MSTYARAMNTSSFGAIAGRADEAARLAFMKKVALKVLASLVITAVAASGWMAAIVAVPEVLAQRWVSLGIMLGGIYGAQFIGNKMTASPDADTRTSGFVIGSVLQGVALSYIVGAAAVMSAQYFGDPFVLVGQAGGLVFLTVLGMVAYLMSGPKELNMVRGALSVLFLPMLGLMVVTWLFPIGGTLGIAFAGIFVAVSAGSLLYSLNQVMHRMGLNQSTAGAFFISTSIVILFWNVLSLLMRLTSRR
jgi:FtsH-binding integral membrane protein